VPPSAVSSGPSSPIMGQIPDPEICETDKTGTGVDGEE